LKLEPPALQRQFGDLDDGLIDVVAVYKINRLTRSLPDFARIVEKFGVVLSVYPQFASDRRSYRLSGTRSPPATS
jgi:hypothetical protein